MRITTDNGKVRSLTKEYHKEARKVLYKITLPVIDLLDRIPINEIKYRIPDLLKPDDMDKYISGLWSKVGGRFASDMVKMVQRVKGLDDPQLDMWEQAFRAYMYERSMKKAKKILTTSAEILNLVIDSVVAEGLSEGQSIGVISGALKDSFLGKMRTIQNYEAERIARTEVIGASNKGSYDGALSTGLNMQKGWSTSGLQGIRPTHLLYESFGWVSMEKEYAAGLRHPGDPLGEAGEIINCRCTIIYNVD